MNFPFVSIPIGPGWQFVPIGLSFLLFSVSKGATRWNGHYSKGLCKLALRARLGGRALCWSALFLLSDFL